MGTVRVMLEIRASVLSLYIFPLVEKSSQACILGFVTGFFAIRLRLSFHDSLMVRETSILYGLIFIFYKSFLNKVQSTD